MIFVVPTGHCFQSIVYPGFYIREVTENCISIIVSADFPFPCPLLGSSASLASPEALGISLGFVSIDKLEITASPRHVEVSLSLLGIY